MRRPIQSAVRLVYTLLSVRSNLTMKPNPKEARNRFVHFAQTLLEIAKSGGRTKILDREKEKSGAGREVESK